MVGSPLLDVLFRQRAFPDLCIPDIEMRAACAKIEHIGVQRLPRPQGGIPSRRGIDRGMLAIPGGLETPGSFPAAPPLGVLGFRPFPEQGFEPVRAVPMVGRRPFGRTHY